MMTAVAYFGLFSVLLFFAVRSSNRYVNVMLLLLIFPCLNLKELESSMDSWRGSDIIGYELEVWGFLGSIISLCSYCYQKASSHNTGLYHPLLVYQAYSIVLALVLTAIVLRFRKEGLLLYRRFGFLLLLAGALVVGYLLTDSLTVGNGPRYFMLAYLPAYGLLLGIYTAMRKRIQNNILNLMVLALVLLFPTISSLPGTYEAISREGYNTQYTGAIGIAPLATALPFTLKQLFVDVSLEGQLWPFSVKLYTLLQACIVFFALPSALLPKTEKG